METVANVMPCLRCGRALELSDGPESECSCGAKFVSEQVDFYSRPGYYREWLSALGCACGRVDHYTDFGVAIQPHRCFAGGVMSMPSPFNPNNN